MARSRESRRGRPDLGVAAVARLAGVSTATVSNTLNRPEIVAPATRDRVMAAIEELDFVPNRAAGALRTGSNRLIGLVVPDIVNPFYAEITDAVCAASSRAGYAVSLCVSGDDPDRERNHFAALAELRAAGAIVVTLSADHQRLERLRLVGSHLVLVDRRASVSEGCSVAIDDVLGGRLATEHLLRLGGPLAVVNGDLGIPQCAERDEGVREALAAHEVDPESVIMRHVSEMTIDNGQQAIEEILEADRPRAIFCTNDQLAVGVVRGLSAAGLSVPDDVAVVGYGDLPLAWESLVPLTSVKQPKNELGELAVSLLLDELDAETGGTEHTHQARRLSPELVIRESAPS
ncbi:LacI family DNA-binding transcriptional regulator [Gordonia sp. SL306]|uniref:LacI family DNA-binding transcriptional regulator n=1 Tax=Gordonia sp. SL306 TaxID=2995145 RepID=UPI0022704589|nr:LacI family DNA-binding transcriptional regulator [Gordonia sp. SL306]WAC57533.1 LacI family DNA-binding transcriptional regulator [Gordonia sp. SL306]